MTLNHVIDVFATVYSMVRRLLTVDTLKIGLREGFLCDRARSHCFSTVVGPCESVFGVIVHDHTVSQVFLLVFI